MTDAAIPLLNLAILGSFMVAGVRELNRVSGKIVEESEQENQ